MSARLRVPGGVSVWGVVAAERPAALLTRTQVNPAVARFDALFAFALLRTLHRDDGVQTGAASVGHYGLRVRRGSEIGGQMRSRSIPRPPQMRRA